MLYIAPNCPRRIVAPNCPRRIVQRRIVRAELSCAELFRHQAEPKKFQSHRRAKYGIAFFRGRTFSITSSALARVGLRLARQPGRDAWRREELNWWYGEQESQSSLNRGTEGSRRGSRKTEVDNC